MAAEDVSADDIAVPRSTGEIISDALQGLRQSFAVIFSLAVPFCAVDLFLREAGGSFLLQVTSKIDPLHADLAALEGGLVPFMAALGFFMASFFAQSLLNGAVIAIGDDLCWRKAPSAKAALVRLVERGAPLLLTSLLFLVLLLLACWAVMAVPMLVCFGIAVATDAVAFVFVGAAVGALLALSVLIVLTLRWSLYAPAVMVEDRSFFGALGRSSSLTAGRGLPFFETPKFRLSVLLLVGLALSGVLQSLFFAPRLALAVATGWSFSNGAMPGLAQMPLWFMVPFGLLEIVTNATVIPFSGLLLALFSFDLRARYEGVTPPAAPSSSTPAAPPSSTTTG
jgi:hypothetical protein